jgi:CRISPR-associated endonuclease/helicase Cas3
MWIRMLFSCVVDADFLDTEGFFSPEKSAARKKFPRFDDLRPRFDDYMRAKFSQVDRTSVNQLRSLVLETCIAKSHLPPGIFSLTVPTGGGKTLGSTAFALHHGAHHEKRRLIYVIPYTSITEQTANQLREIFPDAVVEHHSNIVEENSEDSARNRLASENWDAPVIVTTTVQFFESLFAARPSKCRKLHNIVNSVVILDEIQLLPTDFLRPILRALTELTRRYKVTLVLSTATQPALKSQTNSEAVFEGLPDVTEIIDKPEEVYTRMRRTAITVPKDLQTPIAWEALANELQRHPTVLCIVNRRDDCRTLHALMPRGTIHLSALMCGAHRSNVIGKLKELLKEKIPVRVISTQLVEAGVDLDFPVVFRALAGLDSIAQAAGRCNREGLLEKGEVRLFVPPSKTPRGYLAQAAEITKRLLSANAGGDPLALPEFTKFFKELYWLRGDRLDAHGILVDLAADPQLRFSFRTAADKFAIIDDRLSVPIAVQYEEGIQLLDRIGQRGLDRMLRRQLQRYIVTVPQWVFTGLVNAGQVEEIATGLWAQSALGKYDLVVGLHVGDVLINPSDLIVEPNDKGTIP